MVGPNPKLELRKKVFAMMGQRLAQLGLPAKQDKHLVYKQATPLGHIGVQLGFITRKDGIDFDLDIMISSAVVQALLEQSGYYVKVDGLTWTCGAMLREIWRLSGGKVEVPPEVVAQGPRAALFWDLEEYGSGDGFVGLHDTLERIEFVCDRMYARLRGYGWPILDTYGRSDLDFLKLILKTDKVTELLFPLEPVKPIAGLILARKLGLPEARTLVLENTRKLYDGFAAHGNSEPREKFTRMARQLDLM